MIYALIVQFRNRKTKIAQNMAKLNVKFTVAANLLASPTRSSKSKTSSGCAGYSGNFLPEKTLAFVKNKNVLLLQMS